MDSPSSTNRVVKGEGGESPKQVNGQVVVSPPSTPIVKTTTNKRVIPDTPGSPPIQVAASSPVTGPVQSVAGTGDATVANGGLKQSVETTTNGNSAPNGMINAVQMAMNLGNPQYVPTPAGSVRRPGFPSQTPPSPHSAIVPQSPPKPFTNFISQFQFSQVPPMVQLPQQGGPLPAPNPNSALHGASIPPVPHLAPLPHLPNHHHPMSMASQYGMPNRPRPIQMRPIQPMGPMPMQPQYLAPLNPRPMEGTPLRRLIDMFPHINDLQAINALTVCKGNFNDAAARLTENPDFGKAMPMNHLPHPPQPHYNIPPPPPIQQFPGQSTTKRTLKAPTQTIQQRYTHLNQQAYPNTFPYNLPGRQLAPLQPFIPFQGPPAQLTKSPIRPATKKRKLVRGKSSRLDSDGDSFSEEEEEEERYVERDAIFDEKVLEFLNSASQEEISDISFTPVEHVKVFVENRPFGSLEIARTVELPPVAGEGEEKKRGRGRRANKKGRNIGNRIVDGAEEVLAGYSGVDNLILECEQIGKRVKEKLAKWSSKEIVEDGALTLTSFSNSTGVSTPSTATTDPSPAPSDRDPDIEKQPGLLADDVALKDYQLIGVNWLHLLYKEGLSCILADEMGLGKTCQVIAFLGGLLEKHGGQRGKHLVVVPSSTIENWLREFKRFCPTLVVEPYYGDQKTRAELRYSLEERKNEFHVIVTTYKLATGAKEDRLFLKSFQFDVCVFDEGHMLKNSTSKQYIQLMKLNANFRVLLTGTPLQNNLTELISLLSFILPTVFAKNSEALKSIFKLKPSATSLGSSEALLSQQRITRAKAMMTPFVLRRKKIHVLKDLPKKSHNVEYCEMHPSQKELYDDIQQKQQDQIAARARGEINSKDTNNVLMQLRKAASHPLLFRRIYDDKKIGLMAKEIMKEDKFSTPEHSKDAILEDMSYMWDFTLHKLCLEYPSIRKFALSQDEWMNAGKIDMLKKLLPEMKARRDRVLLFSFFTMMLDILEVVLDTLGITYMRLDGQTKVDERQDMIDQFHKEEDITVFLLSTKAVIIFDGSFNPHDDKQAEDRAHRVGQTRDVTVIRLVTKDTIEEQILHLANTKLALDQEMSNVEPPEDDEKAEREGEKFVARMLIGKNGEDTPSGVPSRVVTPALQD